MWNLRNARTLARISALPAAVEREGCIRVRRDEFHSAEKGSGEGKLRQTKTDHRSRCVETVVDVMRVRGVCIVCCSQQFQSCDLR